MKMTKSKALELIDQKISQFNYVFSHASYENRYDEAYKRTYYGTETLITQLFSSEEAKEFRRNVTSSAFVGGYSHAEELHDYKEHIISCISQLEVYKERISNFWEDDVPEEKTKLVKSTIVPFVSMSFDDADQEINTYVTGILKALRIDFETGERYSKESIPAKVQGRIRASKIFIVIFVKRDKIEGGGFTTPSWLLKELGIAQGCNADVIAWVEKGIKDIAGLNYEKEVIYFDRENEVTIQTATIKFLEALKEHNLT
jgi:hypothetical protein